MSIISEIRIKRYLASSLLLILDIVTFIGIGLSMALTEPSTFFPIPISVQFTFYSCLSIIIVVLFHYDFYTCFHTQKRRYQNKVIAAISVLVLFIIICTLIILQQPIDNLPALVLLFGFVGYVVVSRIIASVFFGRREKVVYWGEHIGNALSQPRLKESYLVGQVLSTTPSVLSFTIYKRTTDYVWFSHKYRFDCLVVDIDILQNMSLLTLQDLLISPFMLKVYEPTSQLVRPLLAKELLHLTEPPATPLLGTNEKPNICLSDTHSLPTALQSAFEQSFNLTHHSQVQLYYLSIRLEKETTQVIQNILNVFLQTINLLSAESTYVVIQHNTSNMTVIEQALNTWIAQAFRQKAKLSGIKLSVIGIGDLEEDIEQYLAQQKMQLVVNEPVVLASPYDEFHIHAQQHIDGLCLFLHKVVAEGITGVFKLASSKPLSMLMLVEQMILAEGFVPRAYSELKLREYEVAILFSSQQVDEKPSAKQVVKGSEYTHIHTVTDNLMSLTMFNQLTHWLLNTGMSQEINMFERVLVTQTLPEVAQNNVVELKAKQIFDK